jgi:hypothetical protein
MIMKVVRVLRTLLIRGGCLKTAAINAVKAYHPQLPEFDKRQLSAVFEKLHTETVFDSSMHRIIVATDAMEMGIDNPAIRLVVHRAWLLYCSDILGQFAASSSG